MQVNPLGEIINKYRKEHDLSARAFARQCGLSHVYVRNLELGYDQATKKEGFPTLATISLLAKGMGKSEESLLEQLAEVISVDGLNDEHKNTVKSMINYFRREEKERGDSD